MPQDASRKSITTQRHLMANQKFYLFNHSPTPMTYDLFADALLLPVCIASLIAFILWNK
jgi:hypothetical protein